jgi:hypothetical protein
MSADVQLQPPSKFSYAVIDRRWPEQLWVRLRPEDQVLGDVAPDEDRAGAWMARPPKDDAFTPGFPTRRLAAVWLWRKANGLDVPCQNGIASGPMVENEFQVLLRRAGLTVAMAGRVLNSQRTAYRLNAGQEMRAGDRETLMALAAENEKALLVERASKMEAPRPLRARLLNEAVQREMAKAEARRAEGKPSSNRGLGVQRMMREADRALKRSAGEAGQPLTPGHRAHKEQLRAGNLARANPEAYAKVRQAKPDAPAPKAPGRKARPAA